MTATTDAMAKRSADFERLIDRKVDEFLTGMETGREASGADMDGSSFDMWRTKHEADMLMDLRDRLAGKRPRY